MYVEFLTLTVGTFGVLLVHELGHLLTARFLGLKVSSLSIGLGPEIIGCTDRCGTRWKIALLPIGGSCAFFDDVGAQMSSHSADHRTCSNAARRQRGMVYLAGPISNLVFAGIVFLVMICWNGKFTIESIELNTELALLIGGLSVAIGLFNLLPILPLDGGRLALLAIEVCRGIRFSNKDEKYLYGIGSSVLAGTTLVSALFLFKVIG